MQRMPSIKKSSPLAYFKRFSENIDVLKQEVDIFNKWQNCSHLLNVSPGKRKQSKKYLKRMTQPKYHKQVVGIILAKQKSQGLIKKASMNGLKSLIFSNIVKKADQIQFQNEMQQIKSNFSNNISQTQRLKCNEIKLNIRKKQKLLEKQWQKLQNYRTQHCIKAQQRTSRSIRNSKQQKFIISKVMKNKPRTYSTFQSQVSSSRNKTFQSQFLQIVK